jgi:sugar/nucleoside kinase (ribokinase family)
MINCSSFTDRRGHQRRVTLFCVLGDAHLDVVVCPEGPVAEETDTPARTWVGAGGQAANVAAWIAALGGRARLIAVRGTDQAAQLVASDLGNRGVSLYGPVVDGPTGVVVSLSYDGASRSMLTDRGVGPQLSAEALDDGWLAGCGLLHLPAYSLTRAPVSGAALAAAGRVARLSVDLSSTAVLHDYGVARFRALLGRLRPEVVFGTEAEADLIGDLPETDLVVKLGARGVRAGGTEYPAHPVDAVDSTGAGDAFAAGYLVGGVSMGLAAAARAVAKMGAMP